MPHLEVAHRSEDILGEGPWWSVAEQALWRVDIESHSVHRWHPETDEVSEFKLAEQVGFAIASSEGRVVVGLRTGLAVLESDRSTVTPLAPRPGSRPDMRFNDGKTDRHGEIWCGTVTDNQTDTDGGLYRFRASGSFDLVVGGAVIPNGIGWSPSNDTFYYTDSARQTIWAYDHDPDTGTIGNRRVFATDDDCYPDGLTVDAEGGVWSAKWDGGCVVRYATDGSVSEVVSAPVDRPTSAMFGGPDLETLFVTTARTGLSREALQATPAGSVLAVRPGVRGLAEIPARLETEPKAM